MVLPVTNFLSSSKPKRKRPAYRDSFFSSSRFNSLGGTYSHAKQWRFFKQSPELYGVVSVPITDIMGDRPSFVRPDGSKLGPKLQNKAERLWKGNRMKETMRAILFDMFVTGDGYGWKGRLSDKERASYAKELADSFSPMLKTKEQYNSLVLKAMQDEVLKEPKKFDYVASSTVQIISDHFDVQAYRQISAGIQQDFTPEEIIHFRYETLDGSVQGYSPLESLFKEVLLLMYVKGNMQTYMENGGQPDKLYILKDSKPGSPAYERFRESLKTFNTPTGNHGSLLASGEVDVQDVSAHMSDLQFKELALWAASNIALAYHIPVNRIPYLVGESATKGDSGGLSDAGYWNMISERQDQVEDLMNSQFFSDLNFEIRLPRGYKQDEVRDAQTFSMNAQTVKELQSIYRSQGKQLTTSKINQLLNIAEHDIQPLPESELMSPEQRTGQQNQNLLNNLDVQNEPDNRKRADTKRNVANSDGVTETRV